LLEGISSPVKLLDKASIMALKVNYPSFPLLPFELQLKGAKLPPAIDFQLEFQRAFQSRLLMERGKFKSFRKYGVYSWRK